MSVGVGDAGASNLIELVLAYGDMNNVKGIFFSGGTPSTDQGSNRLTKIQTRNVSSVSSLHSHIFYTNWLLR